jgi:1,4-dihydroxy-2-naphthoate octaprenyltransferase
VTSAWLLATRPRTLPAAVVPVVVGTAVAARAGAADVGLALACLATALLLQIGTNLVNDWGDFRRGADGPERLGPVRVTQAGLLPPSVVLGAGLAALAAAAVVGLPLALRIGAPAFAFGAAALVAAVAYTAGPFPLAYHALGEVFVFVFFGPVAVVGTAWAQGVPPDVVGVAASLPVGLLATAILLVNNVRDIDGDRRADKRTLAVRIGRPAARALYAATLATALAMPAVLAALCDAPALLLAWLAAPLAVTPARAVLRATDGPTLNGALAATARLHLVFGVLLAAGLAW